MIVRAKRYGGGQEFSDMDMFDIGEDTDNMTRTFPMMERAIASRGSQCLAPILEPDDDFDDFDASSFVGRAYQ